MKKVVSIFAAMLFSVLVLAGASYSVAETRISTLMSDPQARAILERYLPKTIDNPQFSMARDFTLSFVAGFDQTGELSEENLNKIDRELAKLGGNE